jgi:hypothetical protein
VRESTRNLLQALIGLQAGGGFLAAPPGLDGSTALGIAGVTGAPRPRGPWDVIASASADELPGDTVTFVALEDGTLVVDQDIRDGSGAPLADAVEMQLARPYEAVAVRAENDVWTVAAHSVFVAAATPGDGQQAELTRVGDETAVTVDGTRVALGDAPVGLVELLDEEPGDVAITAERLDDTTWVAERWEL